MRLLSVQTLQNGSERRKDKTTQTKRKENKQTNHTTRKNNKNKPSKQKQTGKGSNED